MRQVSLSSSEEELASPEYTSCDDVEIESESVSEKGKHYILIIHLPVINKSFFFLGCISGSRLIGITTFVFKFCNGAHYGRKFEVIKSEYLW